MKHRILTLLLSLLLLAALALPALADDFAYVFDPDGFFSDEHLDQLNDCGAEIFGQTGSRVMFAITDVDSLDENALYDEMSPGDEPGLLIYADCAEGRYKAVSERLPDAFQDECTDTLFGLLDEADTWYEGVIAYMNAAGMLIESYAGSAPDETSDEAPAAPAPSEAPTVFSLVTDEADLLTTDEEAELLELLESLSAKNGRDIAVVTVPDMDGCIDPEEFCDYRFERGSYAPDTVMLMVTMETREYRLSVYGNCREAFPAAQREAICADIVPYLSDGDYFRAFCVFAGDCDEYTEYYDTEGTVYEPPLPTYWILICLGIGLAVALTVTLIMKSRLKSVRFRSSAADYVRAGSFELTQSREHFLYSHVDRVAIPKNESHGGGGGISSSGHSSGGHF